MVNLSEPRFEILESGRIWELEILVYYFGNTGDDFIG